MIEAKHHWFYVPLFRWYTRRRFRKIFHRVQVLNAPESIPRAVCLIGNHFSWWDGFFAYYLNMEVFHKRYHVMMLEEQLSKNPALNKAGAYSINPGTREIRKSLLYTRQLLKDPANLVVFYPQGKIESMHVSGIHFEPGLEMVLKGMENVTVVFYAALTDYFSHPKPSLNLYLHIAMAEKTSTALEKEYNGFIKECKHRQEA